MQQIRVSENKRYLITEEDKKPFFWMADTAWELFHKLNRDEAEFYLETRAKQGFNVIQAVALAEDYGLTMPNPYGHFPLLKNDRGEFDPAMPAVGDRHDYWTHVDNVINKAKDLNLYIGLLPTWGDKFNLKWGKDTEIFTPENAYSYGKWMGARYRDFDNIVWIMGGDRPLEEQKHYAIINKMAQGIKDGDGGRHAMTFHPNGESSSSEYVHNCEWLDFNMQQTGHYLPSHKECHLRIAKDYLLEPTKPVLDGEPCYEDHPVSGQAMEGYYDDLDVRNAAYRDILSGACGHAYGHHSIWNFCADPDDYFIMDWRTALTRPGAEQIEIMMALINEYPIFEAIPVSEMVVKDNKQGINYITARMTDKYLLGYAPHGVRFTLLADALGSTVVHSYWYCPREGGKQIARYTRKGNDLLFIPPSSGRRNDWVLILELEGVAD